MGAAMNPPPSRDPRRHLALSEPSAWVERFAGLAASGGPILDVACGGGRHTRLFLARGHPVTAVDRDGSALDDLGDRPDLERLQADLEDGRPFPLAGRQFAGIVVTNYLHRPLFQALIAALAPGGVLIYETFAQGNERFGKPRNPDHLLRPGELLEAVRGTLRVLAYEDLVVDRPKPAAVQRLCARNEVPAD
jgi:SAM-dependent methyltransferase